MEDLFPIIHIQFLNGAKPRLIVPVMSVIFKLLQLAANEAVSDLSQCRKVSKIHLEHFFKHEQHQPPKGVRNLRCPILAPVETEPFEISVVYECVIDALVADEAADGSVVAHVFLWSSADAIRRLRPENLQNFILALLILNTDCQIAEVNFAHYDLCLLEFLILLVLLINEVSKFQLDAIRAIEAVGLAVCSLVRPGSVDLVD